MPKRIFRTPVSRVDEAWLGMDESTNPMIINCVMTLPEPIDYDQFLETLSKRLIARYSRFSHRLVESKTYLGRSYWETDTHFDLRSQVHHLCLPEPGDTNELQRLVSMLMSEPLDRTRPLWRMYLIDNVNGGCAVYGRLHHAIGDGIALMRVILSLTDPEPGTDPAPVKATTQEKNSDVLSELARTSLRAAGLAAGTLLAAARKLDTDPEKAQEAAKDALDSLKSTGFLAAAATANLAKLALMPRDRRSIFRGDLTPIKRVALSQSIPLDRVRAIGKATGTTVNDVLVAAVAGGLRRYMVSVEGTEPKQDIRATIPVNLRPATAPITLGNKFSLVFLTLPITLDSAQGRLSVVRRRMNRLKRSTEPVLVYEVLNVLGMVPGPISRYASSWFAAKATCILTNVPGPRHPVYFMGKRVQKMMFWVPQTRGVGMGVSILSYAGDVQIGLMMDDALTAKPGLVMQEIEREFETLEQLAGTATPDEQRKETSEDIDSAADNGG